MAPEGSTQLNNIAQSAPVEPKTDNKQVSDVVDTHKTESTPNITPVTPEEKLLPQSKVDQIVKTAKIDSYNKGKNEALEEITKRYSQPAPTYQQPNEQPTQQTGFSMADIDRRIEEKAQEKLRMEMANKVASDLIQKIQTKKEEGKYQDFDDVMKSLDLVKLASTTPHLVEWANAMDNTADILYEIGKYPSKYANLLVLAHTAPHLAIKELQGMSSSIRQNDVASNQQVVNEPLSQVKSSTTGTDNGLMGIKEFKKMRWARG